MLPQISGSLQVVPIPTPVIPEEGPAGIPVNGLDFSLSPAYQKSFQHFMSLNRISMIQAVFIDNSQNTADLFLAIATTNQIIRVPANKQAYLNVLCPNPATLTFMSAGAVVVPVILLNFPVTNCVW